MNDLSVYAHSQDYANNRYMYSFRLPHSILTQGATPRPTKPLCRTLLEAMEINKEVTNLHSITWENPLNCMRFGSSVVLANALLDYVLQDGYCQEVCLTD